MNHLGDFAEDAMVDFKWSSNSAAGASITRATDGTISVYIGNSTTQLTTGVTDTEDFDALTGVHHCRIDLSASASYVPGSECQVVLSASTIDGQTVNAVLATFSIERAGGVLAVLKGLLEASSDGNIFKAVSLQNVDAPVREAVGLASANLDTQLAALQSDTNDIQTRLPVALVSGRMDSSTGAMAANVLTATAINADAFTAAKFASDVTTEFQSGLATAAALATVDTVVDAILADTAEIGTAGAGLTALASASNLATVAGYLDTEIAAILADTNELQTDWANGGRLDLILDARASQTSVDDLPTNAELATALGTADDAVLAAIATVDANVDSILVTTDKLDDMLVNSSDGWIYTAAALQDAPAAGGSAPTAAEIAGAVWEEAIADHSGTAGSTAEALNAAGSAGDPWVTALPGAYGSGSAGFILGTNLNATVSSRASQSTLDVVDGVVDSILADTDAIDARLPSDPADASVVASATSAILTAVDGVPTTSEFEARTIAAADYATAAALATVDTNVDSILADTGTDGVVVAAASKSDYRLSATGVDDILDEAVEGSVTLRQSVRLANSALGGKASGLETTEATFRDLADTKDRLVATVDADGNRTAVTRDLT